jgi:hypothetical protein
MRRWRTGARTPASSTGEVGGLVEADPVDGLGEDAVEDDEVELEVGVEGGAKAVEEGDGTNLSVGASPGTAAPKGGPDGEEEDPEHGPGESGAGWASWVNRRRAEAQVE